MISRRLFAAIGCLVALAVFSPSPSSSVQAADSGPGAFVTRLGNKTIASLTDVSLSQSDRKNQFRDLLHEGFAVKAIGQFVLGKYRRTASPETVDEFIHVFEDYIVSLYAQQFSRYTGEKFVVDKVIATSRPSDSMVLTKIIPTGGTEPIRVAFQVRKTGDTFKILDVRVEGVSMVLAERDEFTSYIAKNGGSVSALIDTLRQRTAEPSRTAVK